MVTLQTTDTNVQIVATEDLSVTAGGVVSVAATQGILLQ
eukprot:SAG11_NODE_26536_length_344_cov_0.620408_1_plen_38_part_10